MFLVFLFLPPLFAQEKVRSSIVLFLVKPFILGSLVNLRRTVEEMFSAAEPAAKHQDHCRTLLLPEAKPEVSPAVGTDFTGCDV